MNAFPYYCFAVLVLFHTGTLGKPLFETSNKKDDFSNFFHLNPPVHEDIKGKNIG